MKDLEIIKSNLKEKGFSSLGQILSIEECNYLKSEGRKLIDHYREPTNRFVCHNVQYLGNYFRHNIDLIKFILPAEIDELLEQLMDKDYIHFSSTLINRSNKLMNGDVGDQHGAHWHHGSRLISNKKLQHGFSYITGVYLDPFSKLNGATRVIPGSHLIKDAPNPSGDYDSVQMTGPIGHGFIMDSGTWHSASPVITEMKERWSLFTHYGPWFHKPFYKYENMFDYKTLRSLPEKIQRLLHLHSIPPNTEMDRINILMTDRQKEWEMQNGKPYSYSFDQSELRDPYSNEK